MVSALIMFAVIQLDRLLSQVDQNSQQNYLGQTVRQDEEYISHGLEFFRRVSNKGLNHGYCCTQPEQGQHYYHDQELFCVNRALLGHSS